MKKKTYIFVIGGWQADESPDPIAIEIDLVFLLTSQNLCIYLSGFVLTTINCKTFELDCERVTMYLWTGLLNTRS